MDTGIQPVRTFKAELVTAASGNSELVKSVLGGASANFYFKRDHNGRRAKAVRTGRHLTALKSFVTGSLVAADLAAIALAAGAGACGAWAASRWLFGVTFVAFSSGNLVHQLLVWATLAIAAVGWFAVKSAYTERHAMLHDVKQSTLTFAVILLIDGFIEFAGKSDFSRLWIVLFWAAAALFVPIARIMVRKGLNSLGIWKVGAAVMGRGEHCASVEHLLAKDNYVGYAATYHSSIDIDAGLDLSGVSARIADDMRLHGAELVILVPDEFDMSYVTRIVDALNANLIHYVIVPPIQKVPFSKMSVHVIPNSDAVLLTPRHGLMSPIARLAKRVFDIAVSGTMLVLMSPFFLVLIAIISLDGGAPFYGHERVGRGGRSFRCLKFRSMAKDGDKILARVLAEDPEAARQWNEFFKLDNDPRITRVGDFLRKTSLDELPQLINVFRGEMSLVGPRPVIAKELKMYYGEDAYYYRLVRPGITGLWQVSGRSNTTYARRVFLDAWYVRNWDHWTDLAILFNTVPSVLRREGAR